MILLTGSSGYVATHLTPLLGKDDYIGVDLVKSTKTDIVMDIANYLPTFNFDVIVNLAAARFDYGVSANKYFDQNVNAHISFLNNLIDNLPRLIIHVSSVASFDGKGIEFSSSLGCDDAYRSTKYIQEEVYQKWCNEHNVDLVVLYPSAIYDDTIRYDTNIGRIQRLAKILPFMPKIDVKKSLTYMPKFNDLIVRAISGEVAAGGYLTLDEPVKTVTETSLGMMNNNTKAYKIPMLKPFMWLFSSVIEFLSFVFRFKPFVTRNRIDKLFSDTSYDWIESIDRTSYLGRKK